MARHQDKVTLGRDAHQFNRLPRRRGERLLDEHVLSSLERSERERESGFETGVAIGYRLHIRVGEDIRANCVVGTNARIAPSDRA